MTDNLKYLEYEIELQPGDSLVLPPALINAVGPGRWVIKIAPADDGTAVRDHAAFLNGYAPGDEGLYDDFAGR